MKKMLAVCAACMVAGLASADVTSDNIVGFISTPAVDGFNWVAPMLTTVGADTVALKDISISDGGAGTIGYGGEIIMVLDAVGDVTASYSYAEGADGYVWNDDMTGDEADVALTPGSAFALYAADGLEVTIKAPDALKQLF